MISDETAPVSQTPHHSLISQTNLCYSPHTCLAPKARKNLDLGPQRSGFHPDSGLTLPL